MVFNRFILLEADVCEKFAKNDPRSKVFVHYDSMLAVLSYPCMMCQRLFSKWSIGIASEAEFFCRSFSQKIGDNSQFRSYVVVVVSPSISRNRAPRFARLANRNGFRC